MEHMMHAHAAAEYEIFEREVKLGHYDILRVELAKALISARAAQIRCGEARARLAKSRDREEALLVRHAEQLSKQEALMATERERCEAQLRQGVAHATYTRLADL